MHRLIVPALVCLAVQFVSASATIALDFRTVPWRTVYVYPVNQQRGIYDAVIHAFAVVNTGDESVTLDTIEIEALKDRTVVQTWSVPLLHLERTTKAAAALYAEGGLEDAEPTFHTRRLAGSTTTPANTSVLVTQSYMLGRSRYLVFPQKPDILRLTAHGTSLSGVPVSATETVNVEIYRLKNAYTLPVAGRVMMSGGADAHVNHRWSQAAEFALDFDALGDNTSRYSDAGRTVSEYEIYGRDVLASADGTVVEIVANHDEADELLREPDEEMAAYIRRISVWNRDMARRNIAALCGNRVVIDHGQDEFSLSCHLKQNSVRVAMGDGVRQGQVIGQVGKSGNASVPHLHFQLSDGPGQFNSRSLPVTFTNIRADWGGNLNGKYLLGGQVVEAKPPKQ